MKKQTPLDEKIELMVERDHDIAVEVILKKDVAQAIQETQKKLKEGYDNLDSWTDEQFYDMIDKIFAEEFGSLADNSQENISKKDVYVSQPPDNNSLAEDKSKEAKGE